MPQKGHVLRVWLLTPTTQKLDFKKKAEFLGGEGFGVGQPRVAVHSGVPPQRSAAVFATIHCVSTIDDDVPTVVSEWKPDADPQRPLPLEWARYVDAVMSKWYWLLGQDPEESEVQHFLELHPGMIPGGSGDVGPGGHHGSEMRAVFRRPRLEGSGRNFEPDFMWVTRSTALITPIMVEIEKPSKRWFKADGRPTAHFRDAHDQLNDWRSWFARDANNALFREKFLFKYSYPYRPLEPQFVLVYGRQSEFEHGGGHTSPYGLLTKRDTQRREGESFMTFDSLRPRFDHADSVTVTMTAKGPRPFAFSPVYGTGTDTGEDAALLGDPSKALDRSVMISENRKRYLRQRWDYWKQQELSHKDDAQRIVIHSPGRE